MATSKPSFPAPSEPNLRRLGVASANTERPLRAQLVVAAVAVLLVVAIPLYILRRPPADSAEGNRAKHGKLKDPGLIRSQSDAGKQKLDVKLGTPERIKCSAAPDRQGNEGPLCDRLPNVERDLGRAILANVDCAPRTGKAGTINYVLTLDFVKQQVNLFPGKSGEWKGPQAKTAANCVKRSLAPIDWTGTPHRYRYYMISILASYPAPDPLDGFPEFE